MQILGFSQRALDAVRDFFDSHKVLSMEVTREYNEDSPKVLITEMHCIACGYRIIPKMAANALSQPWPSDMLRATTWRHEWDQQSRSKHCGGIIVFATEPAGVVV